MGWWDSYGLTYDPFPQNKPLDVSEMELLVQTSSFKTVIDYFPEDENPRPNIVLIHGPFGSGKSTMLRFLEGHWAGLKNVVIHTMDASYDSTTYESFEKQIVWSLSQIISEQQIDSDQSIMNLVRYVNTSKPRFHHVILLDELHKVNEQFVFQFLRQYQTTIERLKEMPVTLFIAGQDSLSEQVEGKGGITGVFDLKIPLLPLSDQEAYDLIDRRLIYSRRHDIEYRNPFTSKAVTRIVDLKSGIPRFILQLAREVLVANSNSAPLITIDELAVSKVEEKLSGEDLIEIRKTVNSPFYSQTRKKLEKIIGPGVEPDRVHDYLSVMNAFYLQPGKPLSFEDLESRLRIIGDLERILQELVSARILNPEHEKHKDKYGTTQSVLYRIDDSVRRMFDLIQSQFKVSPAAYLERVLSFKGPTKEENFTPDRILKAFSEALELSTNNEAVNLLLAAQDLYSEVKGQELSLFTKLNHFSLILDYILKSYHIYYRNEPGNSFEMRLDNVNRDLSIRNTGSSKHKIKTEAERIHSNSISISNGSLGLKQSELLEDIENAEAITPILLRLFREETTEKPARKGRDEVIILEKLESLESLTKEVKGLLGEMDLASPGHKRELSIDEISKFASTVIESKDYHRKEWTNFIADMFFGQLKVADENISKELGRRDESLIFKAVTTAISTRLSEDKERLSELQRKNALSLLVGAFEEFSRYLISVITDENIKSKFLAKESTLGRIVAPILGNKFNSRMMKYNDGNLAEMSPERIKEVENRVDIILNLKDEKLADLGEGATSILLAILIRNYEQHTVRIGMVSGERYFEIFDRILSGFLWFYEQLVDRSLIPFQKIVLYYGGEPPSVNSGLTTFDVKSLGDNDQPTGQFVVYDLVYEDKKQNKIYVRPHLDEGGIVESYFDLAKVPQFVRKEFLQDYHKKCLNAAGVPLEEIDKELFIVKISWFQPKSQNNTFHKGVISFFDLRQETGRIATERTLSQYYSVSYQSGISAGKYPLITPIRFFSCIQEVSNFLKEHPIQFDDLNEFDKSAIVRLLGKGD